MKNLFLLVCGLFIFQRSIAQSADEYFEAGKRSYYDFQYSSSRPYFENALQGYFPSRNKSKILSCFYYLGMGYYETDDINEALDYTIQALEYGEEQLNENEPDMGMLNILFGKLYHYNEDYDSAILFYNDAIELLSISENKLLLGEAYGNRGYAKDYGGYYEDAIADYIASISFLEQAPGNNETYVDWLIGSIPYPASKASLYSVELEYSLKSLESKRKIWGSKNEDEALALKAVAIAYEHLNNYVQAESYFRQAYQLFEQLYDPQSLDMASQAYVYSNILAGLGKTEEAITYAQNSYQIRKKNLGKDHPETYDVFQNIGNIYYDGGRFQEALKQYLAAKKEVVSLKNPMAESRLFFSLANTYEALGDYEQMKSYLDLTLRIQQETNDKKQVNTMIAMARHAFNQSNYPLSLDLLSKADSTRMIIAPDDLEMEAFILNNMGTVFRNTSQYQKAKNALENALTIRQTNSGEISASYVQTLTNYGLLLIDLGNNESAEDTLSKALQITELIYGKAHPEVADNLLNLSVPLGNLGQVSKEITLLERAYEIRKAHFDANHPSFISVYHNLGLSLSEMGRYKEALDYIQKAKSIIRSQYGEESTQYARNLINEQKILSDQGKKYGSLDLQRQAIEIYRSVYNDQPTIDLALAYNNIGSSYLNLNENEQAGLYLDLSLDMYRSLFDETHSATFTTRYNKAQLLYQKSRYDDAIEILEQNIQFIEQNNPKDLKQLIPNLRLKASCYQVIDQRKKALDINLSALALFDSLTEQTIEGQLNKADLLNNTGAVAYGLEDYELAKSSWTQALDIYHSIYEAPSYQLSLIYNNLADLYSATKSYEKAIEMLDKAERMNLVDGTVEGDIVMYFLSQVKRIDLYFDLYEASGEIKYLNQSEPYLAKARELLIETEKQIIAEEDRIQYSIWKGLLTFIGIKNAYYQYLQSDHKKYLQEAFDFAEASKANVLYQSLEKTNVTSLSGIDQSLIKKQKELEKSIIEVREELFKKQYKQLAEQEYINTLKEKLITLNEDLRAIRQQIIQVSKKSIQYEDPIEISAIQEKLRPDELLIEYAMSDDRLFALLITKEHADILLAPYTDKFSSLVSAYRNAIFYQQSSAFELISKKIADLIWEPIEDKLSRWQLNIQQITIVPEGPLNYLPFEALPIDGSYLIEKYAINYAYSARLKNWIFDQPTHYINESLLAFAPVFSDEPVAKMTDGAKDVFAASRHFSGETTRGFTLRGDFISPLPATATEVSTIHAIATTSGTQSNFYLQSEASESQLKSKLKEKHRYLHFATHGFVNEAIPEYSGVFLSQKDNDAEDCILFASEIYTLEIPADLVTLSACETGLGKYAQGEGIVGLTRAFLYAGTRNLLVSQWQVDDASTSQLMIDFYRSLFNGATKTTALREAKLNLLGSDRYNAPYYWAPFVLIGE